MHPVAFPQVNTQYGPPPDLEESQCKTIPAFRGAVECGSVDGATMVVVAWRPDPQDLSRLQAGGFVYLVMIGGLAPHIIGTDFEEVTHPV